MHKPFWTFCASQPDAPPPDFSERKSVLVLAHDLIFIERGPLRTERRVTYPTGTLVTIPVIGANDEEGQLCTNRARDLQTRYGVPYRVVQLADRWRVIRATDLQLQADRKTA